MNRRFVPISRAEIAALLLVLAALPLGVAQEVEAPDVAVVEAPAYALSERAQSAADAIDAAVIRKDLEHLAAPEMEGRQFGPGIEKARAFLAERFRALELAPAGEEGGFFQTIVPSISSTQLEEMPAEYVAEMRRRMGGKNILGMLEGRDPVLKQQVIVLSAHYDHLGMRGEYLMPGADDNASGVAVLLELARIFATAELRPKRSILFASFDAEERGLVGSKYFVHAPTVPKERWVIDVNLDMLGRRMLGVVEETLFCQGWEHSPELIDLVKAVCEVEGQFPALAATDTTGVRSDFGPFLWSGVPALFFSSGEHPDYHRATDLPEKIRWKELEARARVIARLLAELGENEAKPSFVDPQPHPDELSTLIHFVDSLGPHTEALGLGAAEAFGMRLLRARALKLRESDGYDEKAREGLMKAVRPVLRSLGG